MPMEKSARSYVALKFFARTPLRDHWIVKIREFVERFLRKPFWFFWDFLDCGLDTIEKQWTRILISLFLVKVRIEPFVNFHYVFCYRFRCIIEEEFSCLSNSIVYFIVVCSFSFFFSIQCAANLSSVNCYVLLFIYPSMVLRIGLWVISGGFPSRFF